MKKATVGIFSVFLLAFVLAGVSIPLLTISDAQATGDQGDRLRFQMLLQDTDFAVKAVLKGVDPTDAYQVNVSVRANGVAIAIKEGGVDASFPSLVEKNDVEKFVIRLEEDTLIVGYRNIATDDTLPHTATVSIQGSTGGEIMNINQTIGKPGF